MRHTEAEAPLKLRFKAGEQELIGSYSTCTFRTASRRPSLRDRKVVLTWYDARAESEDADEIRKLRADLLDGRRADTRMVSRIDAAAFVDTSRPEVGTLYVVKGEAFFRIDAAPLGSAKRRDRFANTKPKVPAWRVSREIARSVLRRLENPVFAQYFERAAHPETLTPRAHAMARGDGPWREEVYTNQKLAGQPVLARGAELLEYHAKTALRLPREMVSIRWDSCLSVDEGAQIDFELKGKHPMTFYLDDRKLIPSSKNRNSEIFSEAVEAGRHHIRVELLPSGPRALIALRARIQGSRFKALGEPHMVFPGLHVEEQWCTRPS